MTPTFIKSFAASVAIAPHLILAAAADGEVAPAASNTDLLVGASNEMGADAGAMVDVIQGGWGEVRCGGDVSFGDPLTSDANGQAIEGVPVAGSVVRVIGYAMADGSDQDIIPYLVAPGIINAPA